MARVHVCSWPVVRGLGIAAVLTLAVLLGRAAEGPPAKAARDAKGTSKTTDDTKAKENNSSPRGLERLKLPANAIVVVCDTVEQGLRLVPRGVILPEDKYRALQNRIEELERRLKPDRPVSPSTCKLKVIGPVQEDLVNLRVEFQFKPKYKDTLIALGCQGTNPKRADLDGKETLLQDTEDGLVIQAEAGEHTLVLELEVSVVPLRTVFLGGGADWGFKIDLPRAALTTLEFEQFPGQVKEIRCNERILHKAGDVIGLGPVDRLNVTWRKPVAPLVKGPLLVEQGVITVRVEDKEIVTQAQFTLQDQRGQATRWLLQTPPQAEVEVLPLKDSELPAPAHNLDSDVSAKGRVVHTIDLKEASAEPFRVLVTVRQRRSEGRVPIGPFQLLDDRDQARPASLMSQQGTILIVAPPDVRLGYHWPGETHLRVSKEEFTEEELRKKPQTKFRYWTMQPPLRTVPARPGPARPVLLELEVKTIPAVVETQVEHILTLTRAAAGWEVEAVTRIHARPRRAGVDSLDIQLPRTWPGWLRGLASWPRPALPVNLALTAWPWDGRIDRPVGEALQARFELRGTTPGDPSPPDAFRRVHISLADKQDRPFTVTLTGVYRLPAGVNRALLELPRPLNTKDRGSQVEVLLDRSATGQELLVWEPDQALPAPATPRHAFSTAAAPVHVEFAWRPHRRELPVTAETDITLRDRLVHVRQRVHFPATPDAPTRTTFHFSGRTPPAPRGLEAFNQDLEVTVGGRKVKGIQATALGLGSIPLTFGADRSVTLSYLIPWPADGRLNVPLVWPDVATQAENKVRIWSETGATAAPDASALDGPWREEKIEVVPEQSALPIRVLRGRGRDLPLTLHVYPSVLRPLATVLVRRTLIEAAATPDGRQTYRARFLVSHWNTRTLDVELPAPGSQPTLVRLNGKRVTPLPVAASTGRRSAGTRFRLAVDPDHFRGPVILDLHYRVQPKSESGDPAEFAERLRTRLFPPIVEGAVFLGKVRWQVGMSPGWVLLNPGGEATPEQTWGWRGWLLAPQPAKNEAELEEWLTGVRPKSGPDIDETGLVCWQATPAPLVVVHVAQKTWLLGCSTLLLALGLGLSFVPLSRGLFRVLCLTVIVLVAAALAATAIFWPSILPALLYGAEPGAAVLAVVLFVQWMLQRRYRRRLVFMPGFTRLKAGSVLTRGSSSNRSREPSTVDAPPLADSPSGRSPGAERS
jgi:hypothetical protein